MKITVHIYLGSCSSFVKAEEQNLELMSSFVSHLYYLPMDPAKVEGYSQLRERLVELTKEVDPDNLLFYLATPPSLYWGGAFAFLRRPG